MSRESIQKIKETEDAADRIVENARDTAQRMIAAAEADGKALCTRTEEEMLASLRDTMQQLRERTASMSERMEGEAEAEAEEMKRSASLYRKSAEKLVIRGLMSKCR
ncbi:MAG: hypothetical protein IJW92_00710 [Clostridia bacterium]|nr:hypothetical protein [Clostridia bacterium]